MLIVASYMPFSIRFLDGLWWTILLTGMWIFAAMGFASKCFYKYKIASVSIWIYILLGWMPALGGMPFAMQVPLPVIGLIILGGVVYSLGTLFLYHDRKAWYFHSIWHMFVVAGSVIHFLAMYWYL